MSGKKPTTKARNDTSKRDITKGAKKTKKKKKDADIIEKKIKTIREWCGYAEKKYKEIETLDEEIKEAFKNLVDTHSSNPKKYDELKKKLIEYKAKEVIAIGKEKTEKKSAVNLANCLKRIVDLEIDVSTLLFEATFNNDKNIEALLPKQNTTTENKTIAGSSMFSSNSSFFSTSTLKSANDVDPEIISKIQKKHDYTKAYNKNLIRGKAITKTPFTEVYQGTLKGMDVCLKKINQNEIGSDFSEQIKKIKEISHPSIISYFGITTEPPQLVLQFAKKYSLEDILNLKKKETRDKEIKLSFIKKMKIAKVLVVALQWLYSKGFKHLRLKPSNLLFTDDLKLKLADYGLGLRPLDKPKELIESGHAYYYAPELLKQEEKEGDEKSDIYSFGLIIETLLTEKIPFSETMDFQVLLTEKEKKRELPPSTPKALQNLYNECTGLKANRPTFQQINEIYSSTEGKTSETSASAEGQKNEIPSSAEGQKNEIPSSAEGQKSHKIWDKIILEVMTNGSNLAEDVWIASKESNDDEFIYWGSFWKHFMIKLFGEKFENIVQMEKTQEGKCIKYLLLENPDKDVRIHRSAYQNFWGFFPLLIEEKQNQQKVTLEGATYLRKIRQLVSKKWFHGEINNNMAQKRLEAEFKEKKDLAKKKITLFLVRYSTTRSKTFVLCTYSEGTFQKARIYKEFTEVIKFIEKVEKNDEKYKPCERDRKFIEIFAVAGRNEIGGYIVEDTEKEPIKKEGDGFTMDKLLEGLDVPKEVF